MFSTVFVSSYLYFLRNELGGQRIADLQDRLSVRSKFQEKAPVVELFDDSLPEWFGIPLYDPLVPLINLGSFVSHIKDVRVEHPTKFRATSELYPKQSRLFSEFRTNVDDGMTGFIVEAKPGFGKTVCAIHMIAWLSQVTLVVVPRSNLISQWKSRLLQHSDLKEKDIGWVEGSEGSWEGKKVVVGLVHSLALDRMGKKFRDNFGVLVFDEVDRSVPPSTFAPVVSMFAPRYRIGLSATIRRQDGMEVVFQKHVGQVYLHGMDENRMVPKVAMVYFDQSSGYVPDLPNKMNRRGILISKLAKNATRNKWIASFISKIRKSGRKCLVLSDRKVQLQAIRNLLVSIGVPKHEIGFYVRTIGGRSISDFERRQVASACNVILATYGMIALGTDIPELAGLVYATPQSETEQSKGRIERFVEGKKNPVVVDIVDTAYYDAVGWANKRFRHYQRGGLEVKSIGLKHVAE